MIDWNDEREQRRTQLLSLIADAASIDSEGKQSEALKQLCDQPFQSHHA
jgi:hypothetical protein